MMLEEMHDIQDARPAPKPLPIHLWGCYARTIEKQEQRIPTFTQGIGENELQRQRLRTLKIIYAHGEATSATIAREYECHVTWMLKKLRVLINEGLVVNNHAKTNNSCYALTEKAKAIFGEPTK